MRTPKIKPNPGYNNKCTCTDKKEGNVNEACDSITEQSAGK